MMIRLLTFVGVAGIALLIAASLPVVPVRAQVAADTVPEWQKAAGGKVAFDVASVKPNTAGLPPFGIAPRSNIPLDAGNAFPPSGGFFSATNWPLSRYIDFAYKLTDYQYRILLPQMPKWAISPVWFDIEARAGGNPTKDQMRLMMQSLLADRFKLALHWETRQLPVFALVLSKPGKVGPQLQAHPTDEPCPAAVAPQTCEEYSVRLVSGQVHIRVLDETSEQIAARLTGATNYVDRPVLDLTELKGRFDFSLDFTPDANDRVPDNFQADTAGPTFLEALREQAGLTLVPQTGRVGVLIIDHVERPSEN
jgi:uncharacterized protein (TIGR03435 family)